jgi:hypothetical protein
VPLVYHLKQWPPNEIPKDKWPLIPISSINHSSGTAAIEPLPILFDATRKPHLSDLYKTDPNAALADFLPVELFKTTCERAQSAGWGAGVEVGVRVNLTDLCAAAQTRNNATTQDGSGVSHFTFDLVGVWLNEARSAALETAQHSPVRPPPPSTRPPPPAPAPSAKPQPAPPPAKDFRPGGVGERGDGWRGAPKGGGGKGDYRKYKSEETDYSPTYGPMSPASPFS